MEAVEGKLIQQKEERSLFSYKEFQEVKSHIYGKVHIVTMLWV